MATSVVETTNGAWTDAGVGPAIITAKKGIVRVSTGTPGAGAFHEITVGGCPFYYPGTGTIVISTGGTSASAVVSS